MIALLPANEHMRLAALRELRILGTPPEEHFDAVCRTASALFGVPIALVSLIDTDRQWFKARCGLDVEKRHTTAIPLFCLIPRELGLQVYPNYCRNAEIP